jgi:hypothetical protein
MEPPIAIICKCLPLSLLASGDSAVALAALSTSKTFPSAPTVPGLVTVALGSRLKLSMKRVVKEGFAAVDSPSYVGGGGEPEWGDPDSLT